MRGKVVKPGIRFTHRQRAKQEKLDQKLSIRPQSEVVPTLSEWWLISCTCIAYIGGAQPAARERIANMAVKIFFWEIKSSWRHSYQYRDGNRLETVHLKKNVYATTLSKHTIDMPAKYSKSHKRFIAVNQSFESLSFKKKIAQLHKIMKLTKVKIQQASFNLYLNLQMRFKIFQ